MFKVSRISEVEILDKNWEHTQEHRPAYMDIFRISSFKQLPVKLQMGLKASSLLVEEYPLAEKYLTKISDTQYILETNVCSYEGIGRFVLGLLDDIKILHSPDFIEFLKSRIALFNE